MEHEAKSAQPRLWRALGARLLFGLAVILALIWLTFFGLELARGTGAVESAALAVQRTGHYLLRLSRGDLGTAYAAAYGQRRTEVAPLLFQVLPRSLALLGLSLGLAALFGVALGARSARRERTAWLLLSLLGMSMPTFFLALLLQLLVLRLTYLLGRPVLPVGGFGWDAHLLLPALVLAARPLAQVTRVTHIAVAETLRQDFIRTAHSKGLPPRWVWWRHLSRHVAPPLLSTLVLSLRFSLGVLPVVELYFGWPGLGYTLMQAVARQDDLLAVALAVGMGLAMLVVDLLAEMLRRVLDPRLAPAPPPLDAPSATWRERLAGWGAALRDVLGPRPREPLPPLPVTLPPLVADPVGEAELRRARRRTFWRALARNGSLLVGTLLLLALAGLYFAGPRLVRYNPYATQGLTVENGELSSPPYPPSERYWLGTDVLGRDIYSLLVAGARQTLTLVLFATLARLLIGTSLGLLAGLQHERWLDRLLTGFTQVLAALPALIVAMLLILGLGVRNGLWVFLVGLAAVGWGELYRFVRDETVRLLRSPFVESARVVGNSLVGVIARYLLPNLLPMLLSLAALEAAAVMLLVGDLGFVGIFLGGGTFAEVFIGSPPYHYSDIPEWASLLSNVRLFARSYPWTALYPALAFFLTVLAFNLFGEGLRRLLPRVGFDITRLVNRWTVAGAVALVALGLWTRQATGPLAGYRLQAARFDAQRARETAAELAAFPRGIGLEGQQQAAQWLADRLAAIGLQPAGDGGTYFLTVKRDYFEITELPQLGVLDLGLTFTYRQDFAEVPSYLLNAGQGEGELVVLGLGQLTVQNQRFGGLPYAPALGDLDLRGKVVLLLHPEAPHLLPYLPRAATLVVADDPSLIQRRATLSAYAPGGGSQPVAGSPWFYITSEAAQRLLQAAGLDLERLRQAEALLAPDEVRLWPTGVRVQAALRGEIHRKVPVTHVLAYWPGVEAGLDSRLVVLMAPYDGLRPDVLGVQVPGAVNHASAAAVLLEALQTLAEQGYRPKRTIYVAFYAEHGFDYGKTPRLLPDLQQFLFAKPGFGLLTPEVVINLWGLGGGDPQGHLLIGGNGNLHLTQLAERLARLSGTPIRRRLTPLDISVIFDPNARVPNAGYPWLWLAWEGSEALEGLPADGPEALQAAILERSGRTLTLLLAVLGREPTY